MYFINHEDFLILIDYFEDTWIGRYNRRKEEILDFLQNYKIIELLLYWS